MALKTPSALVLALALLALTLVFGACGGGTTANPIVVSTDATTATSPAAPPATTPTADATAPSAARTATTASPPAPTTSPDLTAPPARPRPSGGATADSSTAAADELAPQEAPAPAPAPSPQPAKSLLDERASLILTRRLSPSHYFQQGTVVGTHDGTMEVEARITSKGVLVNFTATLPGGTISGRGVAVAILDSTTWPSLRGRAIVTGGTGRFAGIGGRKLKVIGRAKPDASRAHVRLVGTVFSSS
ncbi:MAG: hypothetical protein ACJ76L_05925 [Conexibacter sp.]